MRVVKIDFDGIDRAEAEAPAQDLDDLQPLVMVTWRDAYFDFDQAGAEDPRTDYLVHTVGFLLSDGTKFISLAQEILPDGDGYRAVTHIPRSIVESMVRLQPEDLDPDDAEV
jgi:hypothetical protein